jgi:hypothetical protein
MASKVCWGDPVREKHLLALRTAIMRSNHVNARGHLSDSSNLLLAIPTAKNYLEPPS